MTYICVDGDVKVLIDESRDKVFTKTHGTIILSPNSCEPFITYNKEGGPLSIEKLRVM